MASLLFYVFAAFLLLSVVESSSNTSLKDQLLVDEGDNNYRFLTVADHPKEIATLVEVCGQREYSFFLYVDGYVRFVAFPSSQQEEEEACPHVMFHDKVGVTAEDLEEIPHVKELAVAWGSWEELVDPEDLQEYHDGLDTTGLLEAGKFPLWQLVQAFEQAHPEGSKGGAQEEDFDAVTSNSADLLIAMGSKLGIKVQPNWASLIARRLHEDREEGEHDWFHQIKKSASFASLFDEDEHAEMADEDIIHRVVEFRLSEL